MGYILNEKLTSTLVVWLIMKRVLRKWEDWPAAKLGLISSIDGRRLRRARTSQEHSSYDILDRMCWTLKRLFTKYVGESGLAYIFSLAYLMKEQAAIPFNLNIEKYKSELESMTADNQLLMYEILSEIEKNDILVETNLDKESTIIKYKNHVAKILQQIASRRNSFKKVVDIQCSDGNWNYDPYQFGYANGMILALGIFDGKDPRFLEAPKKWLGETLTEAKQVGMMKEDVGAAMGGANAGGNQGGVMSAIAGTPSCTVNDIAQFTPRIDMSVGKRRMNRRITYRRKKRKIKLSEGKQVGVLYHYTMIDKLIQILVSNELRTTKISKLVSFTRDKNFHKHYRFGINTDHIRLVFDGDKIANNYKVTPYNDFPGSTRPGTDDETEERIIGPLRNLDKYLIKIQIFKEKLYSIFENEDYVTVRMPMSDKQYVFYSSDEYINFVKHYAEVELI